MNRNPATNQLGASFRDPAGFIYQENDVIFRKITPYGFEDYEHLIQSGLYKALVQKAYIIPHEELVKSPEEIILKPTQLPFISYPYEWCFSQFQDAALLTLSLQKLALEYNMSLKDASAYNIQFYQGKPILIDTLSFEKLNINHSWVAYRQFCQHFLAPLALMSHTDTRLQKLLSSYVDGIPLDFAASLLPRRTKFKLGLYIHLHLHAKYQQKYAHATPTKQQQNRKQKNSLLQLRALIQNLESTIKKLRPRIIRSEWGQYYSFTNYEKEAFDHKKQLISSYLDEIKPATLIDLGGNDGTMTRLATSKNIFCISSDVDIVAVENNYQQSKRLKDKYMLPLIQDLTNPSPNIGWHHDERTSFLSRAKVDCLMALALIHHLAIGNTVPLAKIINYFAEIAQHLIVEFVPKSDSMVEKLLATRKDIFSEYDIESFEKMCSEKFFIVKKQSIVNSQRTLYWLKAK